MRSRLIVLAVLALAGCGGDGGGAVANLWVAPDDCETAPVRAAEPVAFADVPADSVACTFDQAWDAAEAGDRIRVRPGAYPAQAITGGKASATTITGGEGVTLGDLETDAEQLVLEDVTVDVGDAHDQGWTTGSHVTLRRVNVHGAFVRVRWSDVQGVRWLGGELGVPGQTDAGERSCGTNGAPTDPEPFVITGPATEDVVVDGVWFAPQKGGDASGCAPDGYHLEIVRIEQGAHAITIRDSTFESFTDDGAGAMTASVFVTEVDGGGEPYDLTFEDNAFGTNPSLNGSIAVNANVGTCRDYRIAHNTFLSGPGVRECATVENVRFEGNLGWRQAFGPCQGTFDGNVWQDTASMQCGGTDTWVPGPRFETGNLGLGGPDGFSLEPGSPAIDAAGACEPRPADGECDAGADELG